MILGNLRGHLMKPGVGLADLIVHWNLLVSCTGLEHRVVPEGRVAGAAYVAGVVAIAGSISKDRSIVEVASGSRVG
jgi:hypothetical protein